MKKVILKIDRPTDAVEVGNLESPREYLAVWGDTLYMLFYIGGQFYWVDIDRPWSLHYANENADLACEFAIKKSHAEVFQFDTIGELIDYAAGLRRATNQCKKTNEDFF